ncbi:AAA family ATPase [Acinetobacter nosocomialis]|uniref:AAA family ATPase n=1 Tax=Acinetobacter nosocomialis TaxID=106654 RepID=UPI000DE6D72E|nr:AAA family ATPase [Acinetobacter nosocomialis]SSR43561.1 Predicted ATP-binding protein involved in virulence [Acinetobacter baumannii]MBO8209178.1 AAA family ATPase [Acinetobacter nosocomialis]MBO8225629.1 AAA family ATPase [Acinetobacter nosocomialis]MBO8251035.1 AAA family ATPase [Acinetobacter nosocomialis]MBR7690336.1 AAA family ATPase [Acinetobacter nosocomialis]
MYLRNIHIRNIGPIEKLDLELELKEDLNPKPVILIGKNGSGKTYTLSYIVDAFYELAKKQYNDVVKSSGMDSPYFRIISGRDINTTTDSQSGAAYLRFFNDQEGQEIHYCEKIGNMDSAQGLLNLYGNKINNINSDNNNDKKILATKENIDKIFSNTINFFPSFRKIIPHWLNLNALTQEIFNIEGKFAGDLGKEIMCVDTFQRNIQWMLDVVLDSAILPAELDYLASQEEKDFVIQNKHAINNSYRNINKIFKTILDNDELYLKTGWRNDAQSRLSLHSKGRVIVPTLEQLSTGQLVLLNLFITIIRHADYKDLNNSIRLENIEGIVVVDEIDTHLHTKHQSEILPKLIKLFPKIQFIMTSHAPLFVLGMEKEFGKENIQLIDLPSGMNITSERFGEFEESFNVYKETITFEEALHKKIQDQQKPLILVEGKTDIKFMQKAFQLKGKNEWLENIEIDEIGVTQEGGQVKFGGESSLDKGFDFLKHNLNAINRKVLFLYDCDTKISRETIGYIAKDKVPMNFENTKIKKGSENLLKEELFTENFYPSRESVDDYGGVIIKKNFDKNGFCNYICENITDPSVFDRYEELVFPIIEQFLA